MASYKVVMTKDAETDLEDINNYIADHDSKIDNVDYVLDELLKVTNTLANFPMKGSIPKELQSLGIREYRQIFFKTLSCHLSHNSKTSGYLYYCGWQTRHASPAYSATFRVKISYCIFLS